MKLSALFERFRGGRLHATLDGSAWMLIAPALAVLFFVDSSLARTMVEWSLFALVLAGVGIIVSRITFPQIVLSDLLDDARKGNTASALVAVAVIAFVAAVLLAMVMWAKS